MICVENLYDSKIVEFVWFLANLIVTIPTFLLLRRTLDTIMFLIKLC